MRAPLSSTVAAAFLVLLQTAEVDARPPQRGSPPPAPAPAPQAQPTVPSQDAAARPESHVAPEQTPPAAKFNFYPPGGGNVFQTPVSNLFPGNARPQQDVQNPVAGNAEAIQRGSGYFNMFNCAGCHAPNGGGGMGPALSNRFFIYGGEPANVYLSIYHGRPNGMPAWGAMLPENIIWDLVAYIENISNPPVTGWGMTTSKEEMKLEQSPAEFSQPANPWSQTERFSFGQNPVGRR